MFLFKKKTIVVDCFTYIDYAYNYFPIRKALRYYPEVIKKMPASVPIEQTLVDDRTNIKVPTPTVKMCTGINELYKHGAIIPLWTDILYTPKNFMRKESGLALGEPWFQDKLQQHLKSQFVGMFDNYFHTKIIGIWNLNTKSDIKFLWTAATYNINNFNPDFFIPPGVTFYDWQAQTNINAFVRKDADDFTLRAGQPLIHIIPLTENTVEYKCHEISYEEWIKKNQVSPYYPNTIDGLKWNRFWKDKKEKERMDAEDKAERKCPFGFGR